MWPHAVGVAQAWQEQQPQLLQVFNVVAAKLLQSVQVCALQEHMSKPLGMWRCA